MTISFQDVSDFSGISYQGESYGAYWGDFNQDSFPDLWLTNHLTIATLYQNQGDGTFADVSSEVFEEVPKQDIHGAAWADFDNDGDLDLIQQRASDFGGGVNQFYINEEGTLVNRADELGLALPNRGAYPLWFDFDRDGLLDLNLNGGERPEAPPGIFRQKDGVFENVNSLTGFDKTGTLFSILSDVSLDGIPDLIVGGKTIYDTSSLPFTDITDTLRGDLVGNNVASATTADFNGDLLPDLYITNKGKQSDLFQDSSNSFRAFFRGTSDEKGAKFTTTGNVTFELGTKSAFVSLDQIKIGSNGFSPDDYQFTLSPDDPNVRGIAPHEPGVDIGVFVGFDPNLQEWQILWSRPDRRQTYLFVEGEEPISGLGAVGFDPNTQFLEDQLLINSPSGFVDKSQESGIAEIPNSGQSVVAADFDNDMDVDLYVMATGFAANRTNFLYENQGDGTFVIVRDAGGAAGTNLGLGDSATVADYDRDGFQDIFLTNGNFFAGLGRVSREFYNDAPYQLFRNQGNSNHWLEIDLQGVLSNRDGIGSQVFATANGVTQLREQNGGLSKSQSDRTIHFGLGDREFVNLLEIRWNNGVVQKLQNIAVDRLVEVVEGIGFDGDDSISGSDGNDSLVGNNGNDFLDGGLGDDILVGGAGSDRFFFDLNSGNDTIDDFVVGEDIIEITANSNFTQENEILAALITTSENSDGLSSQITLSEGNTIKISHNTDLTADSFSIATNIEMFRFRNITLETKSDLFVGAVERDLILNDPDLNQTFKLENNGNPVFTVSLSEGENLNPFYRLQSLDVSGSYLFVSTEEYGAIFDEDSEQKDKWIKEGIDAEGKDIPEFYLYSPNAEPGIEFNRFQNIQNGIFFYSDSVETEIIQSDPNLSSSFINQGIAFKALT